MSLASLKNLKLDELRPVGQQITIFLRSLIQAGVLEADQRIPSHQELAQLWDVKPSTVHHALQPLVQEGLLSRKPRVGTFVKNVIRTLKHVAIYLDADVWHEQTGAATRTVTRKLIRELQQRGMTYQVYINPAPIGCAESERQINEQLIDDCKSGRVQAILAPLVSTTTTLQLLDLKVPFSLCGNGEYPGAVNPSRSQFIDKGLVALQQQGCRSVGLISSLSRAMHQDNHWRSLHENFQQRAHDLGLHVDPRWVVMPQDNVVHEVNARTFGQAGFKNIWELENKPDGLMVYTDRVALGVIDYIEHSQAQIASQIKFVMHANSSQPLNAPFAFTSLTYDLSKVAQAMVENIDRQFEGQPATNIKQGFDLVDQQPVKLRLVDQVNEIDLDYPLMTGA